MERRQYGLEGFMVAKTSLLKLGRTRPKNCYLTSVHHPCPITVGYFSAAMQYFSYSKSLTGHRYTLHGSENMKLHYGMEK